MPLIDYVLGHICIIAEVWCCSEHYLWLLEDDFLLEAYTAVYCYRAVFF